MFEDFGPPEATRVCHRGSTNPRPSIFEDFDPLEAMTVGHRGSKNPSPSILEDLEPPEAMTVVHPLQQSAAERLVGALGCVAPQDAGGCRGCAGPVPPLAKV